MVSIIDNENIRITDPKKDSTRRGAVLYGKKYVKQYKPTTSRIRDFFENVDKTVITRRSRNLRK